MEIGPGNQRLPGFETLDIVGGPNVDYVWDAGKPLPFKDNTFDLIYASHVLEHIPWYKSEEVLKEWVRVLKHGGSLEIWVPDGLKLCKFLMDAETGAIEHIPDDWTVMNPQKNPFLWVNGRFYSGARQDYPDWHRSVFTSKFLKYLLENVGMVDLRELNILEVRGYNHGWINLGMRGRKP